MNEPAGRIVIAGAGIAGLTAAIAFAQAGFAVTLYERASRLEEVGAGLQLSPNATRILGRLGVLDALDPFVVRPRMVEIRKAATLSPLAAVPLDEAEARWNAPYLTVHRADLQAVLLEVAQGHERVQIVTGANVTDVTFDGEGAVLSLEREGQVEQARCLLAVGADGVWSTLRSGAGQGGATLYTGYLAWRAMTKPAGGVVPADRVTAWLHPRFHLVAYPVRAGREVNLVAVTRSPAAAERWSNAGDLAALLSAMRGASPALGRLVAEAGPWMTWPIHEAARSAPWTQAGRLALIGDAAHAMSPYAAQGAAMAIEDAAGLAASVRRSPGDLAGALRAYETRRRTRVEKVAARGAFNRFTWHAWGPVALARDLVLSRRSPDRLAADLDWLYGYDDEAGV